MNGEENHGSCCFWPILLLVLAFNLFLCVEVHTITRVTGRMNQQREVVDNRIKQAESQMAAARTWQTMLEGIANDLLELSRTDGDIRKVVEKYQIRKNQPVPVPESKDAKPAE
jgi:hypothetical protein